MRHSSFHNYQPIKTKSESSNNAFFSSNLKGKDFTLPVSAQINSESNAPTTDTFANEKG